MTCACEGESVLRDRFIESEVSDNVGVCQAEPMLGWIRREGDGVDTCQMSGNIDERGRLGRTSTVDDGWPWGRARAMRSV